MELKVKTGICTIHNTTWLVPDKINGGYKHVKVKNLSLGQCYSVLDIIKNTKKEEYNKVPKTVYLQLIKERVDYIKKENDMYDRLINNIVNHTNQMCINFDKRRKK